MTFELRAALGSALLLAACSTTAEVPGSDSSASAGSGVSGAADSDNGDDGRGEEAGDGQGDGDGDGDGPVSDLGHEPDNACDPWAQDCPAGEKCSWEQIDELAQTRCVPVEADAKLPGEPCTVFGEPGSADDDCALGSLCSHVGAFNEGVCMALCGGSPNRPICASEHAVCRLCLDCPSLCVPVCDPLAQDCDLDFACVADSGSFACRPSARIGTGSLGDPCEYSFQCQASYACVDGQSIPGCAGAGCCSPFCSIADPNCPQDMSCVPWFEGDDALIPDLGICKIP